MASTLPCPQRNSSFSEFLRKANAIGFFSEAKLNAFKVSIIWHHLFLEIATNDTGRLLRNHNKQGSDWFEQTC